MSSNSTKQSKSSSAQMCQPINYKHGWFGISSHSIIRFPPCVIIINISLHCNSGIAPTREAIISDKGKLSDFVQFVFRMGLKTFLSLVVAVCLTSGNNKYSKAAEKLFVLSFILCSPWISSIFTLTLRTFWFNTYSRPIK